MRFIRFIKFVAMIALVSGLAIALATPATAQKRVRWKMQSAWGSKLPHLGTSAPRFVQNVDDMTDGKFKITNFEPGALIPPLECFDSVSKGSIESCWTTPGYHTGKYPAAAFFTAVPFGPGFGEMMAWKIFGGGNDLRNEIYGKHGMIAIDSLAIGPETSGWFKEPKNGIKELRGMKMRFFGLGAQLMQKVGVSTQLLAGGDIYPALERGVIDATEFSMPAMDISYGFYQIAKYNYFPGWHQQTSVSEMLMNKAKYDELPKSYRAILDIALGESVGWVYAETEAKNFGAMKEMQEKHGVIVKRWDDDTLAAFETAWREVVAEQSAKDEVFKKVADSYFAFRADYKVWKDAQSLKATYLK
jgi:TRAP-type mannitol/chloroaromatic compound transport system substrate-binding protein